VSIAACLSGAVCGDHCSPISDTTIMASAGAHCSHVNHVSTQLPYAMTAAAISAGCYLLCGAAQAVLGDAANTLTSFVLLACAIVIELVVLSIVRARMGHTGKEEVTKS
ncbi:MAG: Na+/H+ antiporter NhaC family protein, partial [Faecalibacterium prausnitzii]|nr:Na+/H+ antiporter NhaC family protein [Faecalibacterium prausnitzii]